MDLRAILRAGSTEEFEDLLTTELEKDGNRLPLEKACDEGGYPDLLTFSIEDLTKVEESVEQVVAKFEARFTERVVKGCDAIEDRIYRRLPCTINIDKESETYRIEVNYVELAPDI